MKLIEKTYGFYQAGAKLITQQLTYHVWVKYTFILPRMGVFTILLILNKTGQAVYLIQLFYYLLHGIYSITQPINLIV